MSRKNNIKKRLKMQSPQRRIEALAIKKRNKKNISFFGFFIHNYIAFSLSLILGGLLILYSVTKLCHYMMPSYDLDTFLKKAVKLQDADYFHLSISEYLGPDDHLFLLDAQGHVLFTNDHTSYTDFPLRELECIQAYNAEYTYNYSQFENTSGEPYALLTKQTYLPDGRSNMNGYTLLRSDGSILDGTLFQNRQAFSKRELSFLLGQAPDGGNAFRVDYVTPDREDRTIVLYIRTPSAEEYNDLFSSRKKMQLAIIPLYILLGIGAMLIMAKRVRNYLAPINDAVISFGRGNGDPLKGYTGPEELRELAENLRALSEELAESQWRQQQAEDARRKLLADISHDLKTPITIAQGYVAALRDGMIPKEQQPQYLDAILRKMNRLSELITNFHDYSKLEHPDLAMCMEAVDICGFVQEFFAEKYEEITAFDFTVDAEIPDEEIVCNIDKALFIRVMENLSNNSMKYNPPGTTIFVSVYGSSGQAIIQIGDDGIGLSQEKKDHLFEPFATGDQSRSSNHGSGLGLAIVKKIISAQHGSIELCDQQQKGTLFEIRLPIAARDDLTEETLAEKSTLDL